MADDQTERPYRSNPAPTRNAPGAAPGAGRPVNDPLAELARLIGQNDPFAEYERRNAPPRPAAPAQSAAPQWNAQPAQRSAYAQAANPAYAPPISPPPAPDLHPAEYVPPAYGAEAAGYVDDPADYDHAYDPNMGHEQGEHQDFYDDVPPRRRMGIMAIAAVFALAVVGTAGAFGYRALFGSSGPSGPPPVIKADTTPAKIVPAKAKDAKDAKNGKLIYDRVADKGEGEKLVSREEQPLDINNSNNNNKPAGMVTTRDQAGMPSGSIQPALGSGIVGAEPKRIHTIPIRPDGTMMASAAPTATVPPPAAVAAPPAAPAAASAPPTAQPAAKPAAAAAPRQPATHAEPVQRHAAEEERHAAPPPRNAPLSLNPNAPRPARAAEQPMQTAHAAQASAPATGSGYAVQLASRHNEADAQSSFHSLQVKFPQQLGGRQPLIRRVDLGAKGVYYRAMVGPFGNADEASRLCSSIKSAGGSCFIQRI